MKRPSLRARYLYLYPVHSIKAYAHAEEGIVQYKEEFGRWCERGRACFTSQPSEGCGSSLTHQQGKSRHSSGLFSICLVCNLYVVDIHGLQWNSSQQSPALSLNDHDIRIADDGLPGYTVHIMHYPYITDEVVLWSHLSPCICCSSLVVAL